MVFAGYGMAIPEAHYDDLAGLDLHGKIAVYVNAPGPANAPGPLKSHYSSGVERWAALHKAGAIGVATIANPRTANGGANRGGADPANGDAPGGGRGPAQPAVILADKSLQEIEGQSVAVTITARGAEKFFAGSGHTFEEIQKLARANEPLPKFALPGALRVKAVVQGGELQAPNVAAYTRARIPSCETNTLSFPRTSITWASAGRSMATISTTAQWTMHPA